jgi:hypothetical protein
MKINIENKVLGFDLDIEKVLITLYFFTVIIRDHFPDVHGHIFSIYYKTSRVLLLLALYSYTSL